MAGARKKEGDMPTVLKRTIGSEIATALNIAVVVTVIVVALATLIS